MRNREDLLGEILSRIADELNITDTMYDKAVTSYQAVGNWIGEGIDYKVTIMPTTSLKCMRITLIAGARIYKALNAGVISLMCLPVCDFATPTSG